VEKVITHEVNNSAGSDYKGAQVEHGEVKRPPLPLLYQVFGSVAETKEEHARVRADINPSEHLQGCNFSFVRCHFTQILFKLINTLTTQSL